MEREEFIRKTKNLDKKLDEMFEVIDQQIKEFMKTK